MENKASIITILLLFLVDSVLIAQDVLNTDKIVMNNGDERIGKVVEIKENHIHFVHQGESLVYPVNKFEINKVQFSSGRLEFYAPIYKKEGSSSPSLRNYQNVVAVLPVSYMGFAGSTDQNMMYKVQSDIANIFSQHNVQMSFQNPAVTNSILAEYGITTQQLKGFSPENLCDILNVEYVVIGNVSLRQTGTTTSGRTYQNQQNQNSTSSRWTKIESNTIVEIKIFSDLGISVFTGSHQSINSSDKGYMLTLQSLLQKTPVYGK